MTSRKLDKLNRRVVVAKLVREFGSMPRPIAVALGITVRQAQSLIARALADPRVAKALDVADRANARTGKA